MPSNHPLQNGESECITVYYDGACPSCVKDRSIYERISGKAGRNVQWLDITGREDLLRQLGIAPRKALMELHVRDENRRILAEMDAYVLLMRNVPVLRPLAWLIGLPWILPTLARIYHRQVNRRLKRTGRL